MKAGDVIMLKNLHEEWGIFALVIRINETSYGTGQIHIIASGSHRCLPIASKSNYIEEVINVSQV